MRIIIRTFATVLATLSLSTTAAAQTLPSGEPYPVPGDSRGLPIRLHEWEYRLPLVGGCSAILNISNVKQTTLSQSRWLGACPFGVAHGPGYLWYNGNTYEPFTFVYGVPVWPWSKDPSWGWSTTVSAPWRYTRINIPALNLTAEQDRAHGNDETGLLTKLEVNGPQIRLLSMSVSSLYCPGVLSILKERSENRFGTYIFDKAARKQLEGYCKTHNGVFAFLQTVETYSWDFDDRRADRVSPREENVLRPCLTETRRDCVMSNEPLIAPIRAELQALNRAEAAADAVLFGDIRERIQPLEQARRERIAAWVMSHPTPPRTAGTPAAPPKAPTP